MAVTPRLSGHLSLSGIGFLDKMCWRTNQKFNQDYLKKTSKQMIPNTVQGHYLDSTYYDRSPNGTVIVQWGKKAPKVQIYNGKVETNPSKFPSWNSFQSDVQNYVADLNEPCICRVDFTVALDSQVWPWELLLKFVDVPRSQHFEMSIDKETGETYGFSIGKFPERLHIYRHINDSGEGKEISTTTHVELQLSNEKCPVKSFHDVSQLEHYRPFSKADVKFMDLNEDLYDRIDYEFERADQFRQLLEKPKKVAWVSKVLCIQGSMDRYGFMRTRKLLNRQSNFSRDVQLMFKPHSILSARALDEIFPLGLKDFFKMPQTVPRPRLVAKRIAPSALALTPRLLRAKM